MYLEHFGLNAPPFQFTASPGALFMSRTHREGLAALEWGLLHEPSGLTLLIGDSGTGKTTLVCALLARQYRELRAAYLGNPKLSFTELLGSVLSQIGVRGGRGSKGAMINAFARFAADLPLNERIAIIVDEAQLLSDDAMEELRLLSNLERHGRKAAQIVLAGQYELARRLASPAMHHFNERIGARAVLLPLTPMECREYIEHRLRLCGGGSERVFAGRALDLLVRHSAGIPRRINALCHNSLLLAYSAGARRVSAAMVSQAAGDYAAVEDPANAAGFLARLLSRLRQAARPLGPVVGVGLLGVAGFVSGEVMMNYNPVRHLPSWPAAAHSAPRAAATPVLELDANNPGTPRAAEKSVENGAHRQPAPAGPDPGSETSLNASESNARGSQTSADGAVHTVAGETFAASAAFSSAFASYDDDEGGNHAPPARDDQYVIVAPGETLSLIALRHLGSVTAVRRIMEINPHIANAAHVYPGEIVYLPAAKEFSKTSAEGVK